MNRECLSSQSAFKKHYSYNPVVVKSLLAGLVGIGAGCAVASAAASTAASSGFAGFCSNFTSWPLIGGAASSVVSDAAVSGATAAAPIAIATFLGVSVPVYLMLRKKYKSFQKTTALDSLARIVGEIVFLPMFARYKELLYTYPEWETSALDSAIEKICEWGYTREYAKEIAIKYLQQNSIELTQLFNNKLFEIEKLDKNDLYQGVCLKVEIPPDGLRKLATNLANDVIPNQKQRTCEQ